MFSSLSSAASSAASWAMGSSTTNPNDANTTEGGESTERVDPTKLFHEFPHPQDWHERVREVLENLKKTNTEVPSKMYTYTRRKYLLKVPSKVHVYTATHYTRTRVPVRVHYMYV